MLQISARTFNLPRPDLLSSGLTSTSKWFSKWGTCKGVWERKLWPVSSSRQCHSIQNLNWLEYLLRFLSRELLHGSILGGIQLRLGSFYRWSTENDHVSDVEANLATTSAVTIDESRLTCGTVSIKTGEDNIRLPDCLSINWVHWWLWQCLSVRVQVPPCGQWEWSSCRPNSACAVESLPGMNPASVVASI